MLQHKILQLLSRLEADEFKGFQRFLQSPFFNSNARILTFYNQLKKYYPEFDSPKLSREKLFAKIYPNKKYHYQQFANLISELTRLTEEYLIQLAFKKDQFQRRKKLIESYGQRNLYDLYQKETHAYLQQLSEVGTIEDHQQRYLLLNDWYFHPLTEKNQSSFIQSGLLVKELDQFYLQAKLLLAVELKNREKLFKEKHDFLLLPALIALAKQKEDNPTIYFYYLFLQLVEKPTSENYQILKKYFLENAEKVNRELNISSFRILNNYCLLAIRNGKKLYAKEHLELYQIGIEKNLILINQTITPFSYLNAITSGILCDQIEWVKTFITQYQQYLNNNFKAETVTLGKALIAFAEENYELITDLLPSAKFNLLRNSISAKSLLVRAYFEMALKDDSYFDLFTYNLSAFSKYLQRVKNLGEHPLKAHQNFVNLLGKFYKILSQFKPKETDLDELLATVKTTQPLSSPRWLINRIEKSKERIKYRQHPL